MAIRAEGSPSLSTSSRLAPGATCFRSSAVICGGGGGGGATGVTSTRVNTGGGIGAGALRTAAWVSGGGGTPPLSALGTPGLTSRAGCCLAAGGLAAGLPVADALAAVLFTLPNIALIPSLTFFPLAPPTDPPAAAAPYSVKFCPTAAPANIVPANIETSVKCRMIVPPSRRVTSSWPRENKGSALSRVSKSPHGALTTGRPAVSSK